MMTTHRFTEQEFSDRIEISGIELFADSMTPTDRQILYVVDYVFTLDWVRSHKSTAIFLGDSPLERQHTDEEIERAIRIAIDDSAQLNIDHVVSPDVIKAAFSQCERDIEINWCGMRFRGRTGQLRIYGEKYVINIDTGEDLKETATVVCTDATVDVATGVLSYCHIDQCERYDGPWGR